MRIFARLDRPYPGAQLTLFEAEDGSRYTLRFTNLPGRTRGWHRQRVYIDVAHWVHARVENAIRTGKDCGIGQFRGSFPANAAGLPIAAMAHNLLRAIGALASLPFAKARAATIRRDLIDVARTARHGRGHLTLHLPEGWHR